MPKFAWPRSIRSKIMLSTAAVTTVTTLLTISVCFSLFQTFLKRNQLQSAEYSLQVLSGNISSHMENILGFSQWCCTSMELGRYLEAFQNTEQMPSISSENSSLRITALSAYERLKEEYQNNSSHEYLTQVIISPVNRRNYLQISDTSSASTPQTIDHFCQTDIFQTLLEASPYPWPIIDNPLVSASASQVIPVIRPVHSPYGSRVVGWCYISISERIFLDLLEVFPLEEDARLYIHLGEHTYCRQNGHLVEIAPEYQILADISGQAFNEESHVSQVLLDNGRKRIMITCPLGPEGWFVSQVLSEKSYQAQFQAYLLLTVGIAGVLCLIGLTLYALLNRIINRPVQKILEKITAVSQGDFSREPAIEWENEWGLIGQGINQMSENVVTLMNKKVEDEKQKKDLEYQILQSQINPHFLYNTLNSIKWMATIQNATGIAEMTTALARLMKNVSKGTSALIPLREELDLVKDYSLIQQYRYGGNITIDYQIDDPLLLQCLIHRFTLQPIIENAMFHGIEPKGCAGKILIRAEFGSDGQPSHSWRISIRDNGVGMTDEMIDKVLKGDSQSSANFFRHVGISNVNKRIQYDFGENYGISIESSIGEYTLMSITLPCRFLPASDGRAVSIAAHTIANHSAD